MTTTTRQMQSGDIVEDHLMSFGGVAFPPGVAYSVETGSGSESHSFSEVRFGHADNAAKVALKRVAHQRRDGRIILTDAVKWEDAHLHMHQLPRAPEIRAGSLMSGRTGDIVESIEQNKSSAKLKFTCSRSEDQEPLLGFVIDPIVVVESGGYTFGTTVSKTYLVTSSCFFTNTVSFRDKAVIKYAGPYVLLLGGIVLCPASGRTILTSKDEDLFGEIIPASSHSPALYTGWGINLSHGPSPVVIRNLKIRFAQVGIDMFGSRYECTITNVSAEFCCTDIQGSAPLGSVSGNRCSVAQPYWSSMGSLVDVCSGSAGGNTTIPDDWEYRYFGECHPKFTDTDRDCIWDEDEWRNNTDPAQLPDMFGDFTDQVGCVGGEATFVVGSHVPCALTWSRPEGGTLSCTINQPGRAYFSNLTLADEGNVRVEVRNPFNPDTGYWDYRQAFLTVLNSIEVSGLVKYVQSLQNGPQLDLYLDLQNGGGHLHHPSFPNQVYSRTRNPNSLIHGFKGLTAISPCSERCAFSPEHGAYFNLYTVTAIAPRLGYMQGHGVDPNLPTILNRRVFFFDINGNPHPAEVQAGKVRYGGGYDYTILLLKAPLDSSIDKMALTQDNGHYTSKGHPYYYTCTHGKVQAHSPGFDTHLIGGGDSGNPLMLLSGSGGGTLVMFKGQTTSGLSAQMKADIVQLCEDNDLDPDHPDFQITEIVP